MIVHLPSSLQQHTRMAFGVQAKATLSDLKGSAVRFCVASLKYQAESARVSVRVDRNLVRVAR